MRTKLLYDDGSRWNVHWWPGPGVSTHFGPQASQPLFCILARLHL